MQHTEKLGVYSEVGKLKRVMVCAPGLAHTRLTPENCDELLFDDVMWVSQAKRDHFDFVTKMRKRGVEVLEMHNLLAETLSNPEALKWVLDRKITPNMVNLTITNELRAWLKGLSNVVGPSSARSAVAFRSVTARFVRHHPKSYRDRTGAADARICHGNNLQSG